MSALAQAYVNFQSVSLNINRFQLNADKISYELAKIAGEIYENSSELDVRAGEGSFKVWGTVFGVLFAAYQGIATYSDFRSSVVQLCKDADEFGIRACQHVRRAITDPRDIYVKEQRRKKVPGQIIRLLRKIEQIEKQSFSNKDFQKRVATIYQDIDEVIKNLDKEKDRMLLLRHIQERFQFLPFVPSDTTWQPRLLLKSEEYIYETLDQPRLFYQRSINLAELRNNADKLKLR